MSDTATLPPPPAIGEDQRLGATLVLSFLLHGMVVLGVGWVVEDAAPVAPMLDVILTESRTPLSPKEADFLAQANNQGGGEHDKATRPREPQLGAVPQAERGVAPQPLQAQSPAPAPPREARVVTTVRSDQRTQAPSPRTPSDPTPLRTGPAKVAHDVEMARRAAEIHMRSQRYAKRPSRKFVSASTKEYAWAAYLREWVDRVERVGNLNYPDEARRRNLSGTVVINIGVYRDGRVERAYIVYSSGVPLLDESALRIAKLAEPYPPLPKTEDSPDILNITRTWRFLPGGELVDE